MKSKIIAVFVVIALIFFSIILNLVIIIPLGFFNNSMKENSAAAALFVFLAVIVPIYFKKKSWFRFNYIKWTKLFKYISFLILYRLFVFFFNTKILNWEIVFFSWFKIPFDFETAVFLFATLIIAPISEELLFRGIALEYLIEKKVNDIIIVFTTSILFGLSHLPGLYHFIFFSIFGALLAMLYLKERNIWYCIILHFLYNLSSALIF